MLITNGTSLHDIHRSRRAWVVIILCILLGTIGILTYTIQVLQAEVATLQEENATAAGQIASFERSYCEPGYTLTKANTTTRFTLTSAGHQRSYQVHTPSNYDPSVRYPVIVTFDGIGGSGVNIEGYAGVNTLPVIAVYPDSLMGKKGFTAWQGAPYSLDGDYDIAFIRQLLDELPSKYCTDSTKTYALGMSNGGGFAALAGCRMSDRFRAVAGVSGAYYTPCDNPKRLASMLVVHGTDDQQVPLKGSKVRKLPEVSQWASEEATERGCEEAKPGVVKPGAVSYDWSHCKNDSMMRLVVLQNQKHGWLAIPQNLETDAVNTTEYIWRFFEESAYAG